MPRFHDPALRTPERVRAVTALHWLGAFHLIFVPAFMYIRYFHLADLRWRIGVYTWNDFSNSSTNFSIHIDLIFASLLVILGISAVAAAIGICRRRWWGLWLGFAAVAVSSLCFLLGTFLFYVFLLSFYSIYSDRSLLYPGFSCLVLYLCVGVFLTVLAGVRCLLLYKTEWRNV